MPFNANTYRANKHRKAAKASMAEARDIKKRAAVGDAYDWELPRIENLVTVARLDMRLARSYEVARDLK